MVREEIIREDKITKVVEMKISRLNQADLLIIWGTGSGGDSVFDFIHQYGSRELIDKVEYFADNNKDKQNKKHCGKRVLSADEAAEIARNKKARILIATMYMQVTDQLKELGVPKECIDDEILHLANGCKRNQDSSPLSLVNSNWEQFEKVYALLADEKSRQIWTNLINARITLDASYLKNVRKLSGGGVEQYFDTQLFSLSEHEIFADCGSYDGDTLEVFERVSRGKFEKYFAIEANAQLCNILSQKVKADCVGDKIRIINRACWDCNETLKFTPQDTAGHVSNEGGVEVEAGRLDQMLEGEKITFIKMDIEGAEERALIGAENLIRVNRPLLAICIYHRLEDFYKLPLLIKSYCSEYQIYIRHYMDRYEDETVCYAIPPERIRRMVAEEKQTGRAGI